MFVLGNKIRQVHFDVHNPVVKHGVQFLIQLNTYVSFENNVKLAIRGNGQSRVSESFLVVPRERSFGLLGKTLPIYNHSVIRKLSIFHEENKHTDFSLRFSLSHSICTTVSNKRSRKASHVIHRIVKEKLNNVMKGM